MYTNANSLLNKMQELRLRSIDLDVIAVVETHVGGSIHDAEISLDGYKLYRLDRQGRQGGGLALYVSNRWKSCLCADMMQQGFNESLWCTVSTNQGSLLVGVCYRCPTSDGINNGKLLDLLDLAADYRRCSNVMIMGDFNYPSIDFMDQSVSEGRASDASNFYDKCQDLCLFQHVHEPTRFRAGQRPSCLDYLFTDEENLIQKLHYLSPLGKSDHVTLRWEITVHTQELISHLKKLNYWKGDYTAISQHLRATNWYHCLQGKSVIDMWRCFKDIITNLIDTYVPLKSDKFRKKKGHWLRSSTIRTIKQRDRVWKKYVRFKSGKNFEEYKNIRNTVNSMVRADGDAYRKSLLNDFKGRPKKFYGYMRNLQTVKDATTVLSRPDGSLTSTDQDTAEELKDHYQKIYTSEPPAQPIELSLPSPDTCVDDQVKFDVDSVLLKLRRIRTDGSPGPDGLHPMVLANCAAELAEPLAIIFQESYHSSILPPDWRSANIVPIFKKGDKSDPNNYRPVSLTSVPCKIMESIIKDNMISVLERNQTISRCQHGFMKGRSCLTNLLESLEQWTHALDQGYGVDVLYLDYRKAFDSVPHKRLLYKLSTLGFHRKLLAWIESFLSDRVMRVGVRGSFSTWFTMLSGVPQGSVLGPILFLLFVNDLPHWIKNSIRMFADDTKVWKVIESDADCAVLQNDIDALLRWSEQWLLQFNPEKCKVMSLGHSLRYKYVMIGAHGTTEITRSTVEKDLGVHITDSLKPSTQCMKAASKARSVLGMVRRHFRRLDCRDFLLIYKTYIRPHVEYCIQSWAPYLQKDIQCLESVQRSATRLIYGFKKLPYEQRLARLGLTTLQVRRERGDLIECYKILTGKENVDAQQFFRLADSMYDLRGHSLKLVVNRSRLSVRQNFFSQRVVNAWNGLPQNVIDAPSINSFKNRLDKFWKNAGYGH